MPVTTILNDSVESESLNQGAAASAEANSWGDDLGLPGIVGRPNGTTRPGFPGLKNGDIKEKRHEWPQISILRLAVQ